MELEVVSAKGQPVSEQPNESTEQDSTIGGVAPPELQPPTSLPLDTAPLNLEDAPFGARLVVDTDLEATSPWARSDSPWSGELEEESGSATSDPNDDIFRDSPPAATLAPEASEEQVKLAAERAARRQASMQALTATAPPVEPAPEPVIVVKRSTDKFFGSLGLFLLRAVVAGILLLRGLHIVTNLSEVENILLTHTIVPEPKLVAMIVGITLLVCALLLLVGLLTRAAGFIVAALAIGTDVLYWWGPSFSIMLDYGVMGDFELLGGTVGLLFLLVGGGGWSLDRAIRASWGSGKSDNSDI